MEVSSQLDFSKHDLAKSDLRYHKLTDRSGVSSLTMSASGGEQLTFSLPGGIAFNPARSYISFNYNAIAPGTAARYNHVRTDYLGFFSNIALTTQSGNQLENLQYPDGWTNIAWSTCVSLEDALTNNIMADTTTFRSTDILAVNRVATQIYPAGANLTTQGGAGLQMRWLVTGGNNDATPVLQVRFHLKYLPHSLFAQDKSIYLSEPVQLTFTMASYTRLGNFSNSDTDPASANVTALAGGALASINFQLATENNPAVVESLRQQVYSNGGLSILYDHPVVVKQSLATGAQSLIVRLNRSHGSRLKRCFTAVVTNTDATNTILWHPATMLTSHQQYLNNVPINDDIITITDYDYWSKVSPMYKGSLTTTGGDLVTRYVISDWFDGSDKFIDQQFGKKVGLPLDDGVEYSIQATGTAAAVYYTACIVQKELMITPQGMVSV